MGRLLHLIGFHHGVTPFFLLLINTYALFTTPFNLCSLTQHSTAPLPPPQMLRGSV